MTAPTLEVQLPALAREHGGPTSAVWREQVIAEADQTQFALESLGIDDATKAKIMASLNMVRAAATDAGLKPFARFRSAFGGASIERAWGAIDAANEALLRAAPPSYLIGQLPRIRSRVEGALGRDDTRRTALAALQLDKDEDVTETARELVVAAFHSANGEERRKYTRVRSFRNMLHLCGIFLTIAAIGIAVLGWTRPDLALLCFQPPGQAVCPTQVTATVKGDAAPQSAQLTAQAIAERDDKTREAASSIDLLLVELIGLVAAALAAATALRRLHGTSTPFSIPLALALLKLPSGALTAALGLLLMRADFVPGLSALDTPAQIIGWAVIFGYAQELFTRFVDQRAQTVINTGGAAPSTKPGAAVDTR